MRECNNVFMQCKALFKINIVIAVAKWKGPGQCLLYIVGCVSLCYLHLNYVCYHVYGVVKCICSVLLLNC